MGHAIRKRVLGHMGTYMSAYRFLGYHTMYEWRAKNWLILCACTERRSESAHLAHVRRHFFARGGQYDRYAFYIINTHCPFKI